MARQSYSISTSRIDESELNLVFQAVREEFPDCPQDIDLIFSIAVQNRELFPGINLTGEKNIERYLQHWVKGYYDALLSPPSKRVASPKGSCSDPAIRTIVQTAKGLSETEVLIQEKHHNLFMSAENIQGNLLEEYIAGVVRKYGWLWCAGNVLKAIDFCCVDGSVLIQIKNKSNTENSSSSAIRDGTSIEKWYRLGTRTVGGRKQPRFMWDALNTVINSHTFSKQKLPSCSMSEDGYNNFLQRVTSGNTQIITDE